MIKHAAIKKDRIVYVGHRHADCIAVMVKCGVSSHCGEQGFVNDVGDFLTRHEAFKEAAACGQIIKKHGPADTLFSEDIY